MARGEFGTGKSWFTLKYAHDKVGRYRHAWQRGLMEGWLPKKSMDATGMGEVFA